MSVVPPAMVAPVVDTRPYAAIVFIDFETHRFRNYLMAPPAVVLAWATDGNYGRAKVAMVAGRDAMRRHIADLLTRANEGQFVLAGYGVAFDMMVVIANWPELIPLVFDTYAKGQIACAFCLEKLIDIANGTHGVHGRKYNLKEVTERRLGIVMDGKAVKNEKGEIIDEGVQMDFERLEGVPLANWPQTHKNYVLSDVKNGLKLMRNQEDRLRAIQYDAPDLANHCRADFALRLTSAWGMTPHRPSVQALHDRIIARQAELVPILKEHGLVNIRERGKYAGKVTKSNKAMQQLVYEAFNGKPPKTPKGAVIIDSDTLEDADLLLNGEHRGFDAWTEFAGLGKTDSTYLSHWWDPITHSSYNPLLETGRTSCFKWNAQNVPREEGARECFHSRPGMTLASADYDTAELRGWGEAQFELTGRSVIGDRYIQNPTFDPHTVVGAAFLGISEEEAMRRKELKDKEVLDARQAAKPVNFGLPGGMGVAGLIRFARGYDMRWLDKNCPGCQDLDSWRNTGKYVPHNCFAHRLKETWTRQWNPREYFGYTKSLDGTLIQLYSRRRRGGVTFTSASNSIFQGIVADAAKEALWQVVWRCFDPTWQSPLFGCRPWGFFHDDIAVEAPDDYAAEAAEELAVVMVDTAQRWIKRVPMRASPLLTKVWSKKAFPVRDKSGRLVPWQYVPTEKKAA